MISTVKMILAGVTQTDIKCRKPVNCNAFFGLLITEKVLKSETVWFDERERAHFERVKQMWAPKKQTL